MPALRKRLRQPVTRCGSSWGILTKAQSEAGRLESRAAALKPWESLDLPLERSGTAHTIFRLGVCPGQTDVGAIRVQMEAEGLAAELYEISADKLQKYLLVIVHRGDEEKTQELLRPFGFSAVTFQGMTGTAAENIRSWNGSWRQTKKTQDDAAAAIAASAEKPGRPSDLRRPAPGRGSQGAVRRERPDG